MDVPTRRMYCVLGDDGHFSCYRRKVGFICKRVADFCKNHSPVSVAVGFVCLAVAVTVVVTVASCKVVWVVVGNIL